DDKDLLILESPLENPSIYRVFGEATCANTVGWTGLVAKQDLTGTESSKVVDFSKVLKFKASCHKVCDSSMLIDTCPGGSKNCAAKKPVYSTEKKLECPENYRLFLKHTDEQGVELVLEESDPVTCSNEGWKDSPTNFVIDFKNPKTDISKNVHHICKQKCHPDFVGNLCDSTTDTTCSEAIYDENEWKLGCAHDSEILVIEFGIGTGRETKESFSNATCSEAGWKNDGGMIFDLSGAVTNYNIKAKCVQVCHPDTLTGTASSRKYSLDNILTCEDENEMLVFEGNKWYTDLSCSKKGWESTTPIEIDPARDTKRETFTPSTIDHTADHKTKTFTADCIASACFRPPSFGDGVKDPCLTDSGDEVHECRPQKLISKYAITCKAPSILVRVGEITIMLGKLRCQDEKWINVGQIGASGHPIVSETDKLDLACRSDDSAKCENQLQNSMIQCTTDANCDSIKFNQGLGFWASRYTCPTNRFYVVRQDENDKLNYYSTEGNAAIECKGKEFNTPKWGKHDSITVSKKNHKIGCVKWVPCNKDSPINTDCSSLTVKCDADMLKKNLELGSKMSGNNFAEVKCDSGMMMYHKKFANKWSPLVKLQCKKDGAWGVFYQKNPTKKEEFVDQKPKVVCVASDPNELPPAPKKTLCELCPAINNFNCDGCEKNSNQTVTKREEGDKCIIRAETGRFVVNNERMETPTLTCEKNKETDEYEWKSDKGELVSAFAIKKKMTDHVDVGMIVGIIVGVLLLLAIAAGAIVFVVIRRRRELQRLETLQSKGLEQKNDTIIDNIEVDDPKTIIL
ncbi:hypothetical protein PENTCL1PPCAC_19037, partial [Pristionchus entomophagus]